MLLRAVEPLTWVSKRQRITVLSMEEATTLCLYSAHLDILLSRPTNTIIYILELTEVCNRYSSTTTPSVIAVKKKI